MKKHLFLIAVLFTAIMTLNSCIEELENEKSPEVSANAITLVVDAGLKGEEPERDDMSDTKTVISGSSIKWSSSGERITVYEKATKDGTPSMANKTSNVGSSSDSYVTMSFNVSLDGKTADNFTYYGSYPSSANVSTNSTQAKANLETKFAQTPVAASFDPSADLMISKSIDNDDAQATSLSMQFARVIAIGKMTIENLPVDEFVSKVTFSADNGSAVTLAGRTNFDLDAAAPVTDYGDALAKKEIVINTSALSAKATSSMDVWFTCYPFALTTGDTFTVVVEAGAYQISRNVTIPAARELNFVEGKVSRFSVDMSTADVAMQQPWVLYEGAFTAGDYLIVSAGKAMKASITSNRFDYTTISAVNNEVFTNDANLVWRAAASSTYWTLYNPEVDKYAASTGAASKAQLLGSDADDKKLWSASGDGTYEFVNKQNTTNGVNANLRLNGSYGFACYGTGTGSALLLYKKDIRPYLSTPTTVTASINGSDDSVIDVTFSAVANAGSYVIVAKPAVGESISKEGVISSPATISVADGLAYETEYEISVYAVPSDVASYRNSLMKTAASPATTGERPTPSLGTMIWSEDFAGWTSWTSSASGATHVYGGGTVTYSGDASGTDYKNESIAGAIAPEVMVKADGNFTVSDVPITRATSATLFYKTNNQVITVTTSPSSTVTVKNYGVCAPKVRAIEITSIPADTDLLDIVLSASSNSRIDNLILRAGTKSFQTLSFTSASVSWTINTDCSLNTEKAGQTATGASTTVSYSSSDETVATVNPSTGAITPLKAGNTTITASAIENASYWEANVSYTLTIVDDSASAATFTFADLGFSSGASLTTISSDDDDNTDITLTFDQGEGTNAPIYHSTGKGARLYNKNTLQVSGGTITSIVFTYATGYDKTLTASPSGYDAGTWTGSASTVTFTNNESGQARIQKIVVTYTN